MKLLSSNSLQINSENTLSWKLPDLSNLYSLEDPFTFLLKSNTNRRRAKIEMSKI